jgi:transposase InsO family protein
MAPSAAAYGPKHEIADSPFDREIFYSLREAEVLIERWRRHDTTIRPHSALGYRPPAPEAMLHWPSGPA